MKLNIKKLKQLLRESLLTEETDTHEQEVSLDAQIDRYFAQYESEAKTSKKEGRDFRMLTRRILGEAGEDDKEPDADEQQKLTIEDIDVESFVNSIVRLIDNYDSLLEVRNTIIRRALNFVSKSYEDDVVRSFKTVLRDSHGMVAGESDLDVSDEEFKAPPADRAGASLGGGAP